MISLLVNVRVEQTTFKRFSKANDDNG